MQEPEEPPTKRIRLSSPPRQQAVSPRRSESETESGSETASLASSRPTSPISPVTASYSPPFRIPDLRHRILVLKLDWIEASMKQNRLLPFDEYLVYHARIITEPEATATPKSSPKTTTYIKMFPETSSTAHPTSPGAPPGNTINSILARARAEAPSTPPLPRPPCSAPTAPPLQSILPTSHPPRPASQN